jgi:hypothetical protein
MEPPLSILILGKSDASLGRTYVASRTLNFQYEISAKRAQLPQSCLLASFSLTAAETRMYPVTQKSGAATEEATRVTDASRQYRDRPPRLLVVPAAAGLQTSETRKEDEDGRTGVDAADRALMSLRTLANLTRNDKFTNLHIANIFWKFTAAAHPPPLSLSLALLLRNTRPREAPTAFGKRLLLIPPDDD